MHVFFRDLFKSVCSVVSIYEKSWHSQIHIYCTLACSGYCCSLGGEGLHFGLVSNSFPLANKFPLFVSVFEVSEMEITLKQTFVKPQPHERGNLSRKRNKVITLSVFEFMLKHSTVKPHGVSVQ
ncbi:hypothetical protein PDJAM_G00140080, partial [Pangasius djambal]|nr:hypothetical protein [Pangasius djambal]